jgi:cytoskeletal protein RodZ
MGTFGDSLRDARQDLGVTLVDAERETRIHRRYLEALENEDPTELPPGVYTRGFIRTYCKFLGLNGDAMIDLFMHRSLVEESAQVRPIAPLAHVTRSISIRPLAFIAGAVVVLLLGAYLWSQYNAFVESLGRVEQLPSSRSAAGAPRLTPSPLPVASPAPAVAQPSPAPVLGPARGLVVEARVVERTWLEVWTDGKSVLTEQAQAGTTHTFTAEQQVRMRVGNAAGVQVIVNGASQGPLGARGQAVDASWGRQ